MEIALIHMTFSTVSLVLNRLHQKGKWSPIALGEDYMPTPMSA